MGQIVLSLKNETEKELRKLAVDLYNGKKGALSEIVSRGITLVSEEEKRSVAHKRLLEYARNAKDLGVGKFNRDEANAR
jgi:hypothetical protein